MVPGPRADAPVPDRFWDAAIPAIEAAIAQTRSEYRVDDRAITLTGLSLGGYATWIWGAQRPTSSPH